MDTVEAALGFRPIEDSIRFCPHNKSDGCACRKPGPLMLEQLMDFWGVNPEETLFVGDMESDRQAAENAGCDFVWARDFFRPRIRFGGDQNNYPLPRPIFKTGPLQAGLLKERIIESRII